MKTQKCLLSREEIQELVCENGHAGVARALFNLNVPLEEALELMFGKPQVEKTYDARSV